MTFKINKFQFQKLLVIVAIELLGVSILFGNTYVQDDTLYVPMTSDLPVIDGVGNDTCWNNTSWQTIDQVWIPLDDHVDSADFYGRFKILWSPESNLLYFLSETNDDVWVDGYVFNQAGPGAYEYDCLEIFFDEDMSGGYHLFDYFTESGDPYGYNAENAFSYHISVIVPDEGVAVTDYVVVDGDGTNWFTNHNVNYASHFEEMAVRREGNVTTWEMSIMVYDSSYNTDPAGARVTLANGKVSGIAVAYCDDDTPDNIQRQNFFGSVPPNYSYLDNNGDFNDCWKNADHYGAMKLIEDEIIVNTKDLETNEKLDINAFPNPVNETLNLELNNETQGESIIKLLDASGRILKDIDTIDNTLQLSMKGYPTGLYYLYVLQDRSHSVMKIEKINRY